MFEWLTEWLTPEVWAMLWTLLPVVGFGGGGSTSTTVQQVEPATPQDLELKQIDLDRSKILLEQEKRQQAIQNALFFGTPLPADFGSGEDFSLVQSVLDQQRSLVPQQLAYEQALANFNLDQIQALEGLGGLQGDLARQQLQQQLELLPIQGDLAKQQNQLASLQLGFAESALPLQQRLLEEQVAQIERGGLPSPEIQARIDEAINRAKEIGVSDIQELAGRQTRNIIAEASGRGLRPSDGPIQSQASLIGAEEARQIGQLTRGLEQSRAEALIGQPLQTASVLGPLANQLLSPGLQIQGAQVPQLQSNPYFAQGGNTQNLLQNAQQFQQQFGAQLPGAFASAGQGGLAFGQFKQAPTFGPQFYTTTQSNSRTTNPGIGYNILSGMGQGLGEGIGGGLGALMLKSDIRLKEHLTPILDATELVRLLHGYRFNWKDTHQPDLGVIAQEVEQILPEAVREESGVKRVNYGALVAVLLEAVKDLQYSVDSLQQGQPHAGTH